MKPNDAWSAVAELAASQHGSFHRRQAAEHGLSNKRLETATRYGLLRREFRDVFVIASVPRSWRQSLSAHVHGGSTVSHRAAAALYGLDGFAEGIIEVTRHRVQSDVHTSVVVHRSSRLDDKLIAVVDGIRCTNVAVTLADLGAVIRPDRVEKALDSALRLGYPLSWIRQTLDDYARPGPTGTGVLRRILDDPARTGTLPDSWFERRLAKLLVAQGLPRPVLQHAVGGRRLDLAYPEAKLGVEAHSRQFHFGRQASDADHERELALVASGWQLVYVTWDMTRRPEQLAARIAGLYRSRHNPELARASSR